MQSEGRRAVVVVAFAALAYGPSVLGQQAPALGNAASFAVLGGSAVTNSGLTVVTGNLGVSPGSTINGFSAGAGAVKLGDVFRNDAVARAAQRDAVAAYDGLSQACTVSLPGTDFSCDTLPSPCLSGTFSPGVYCFASAAQLTGPLILNGGNNSASAVWIFRIPGTFTTAPDSRVLVINGGKAANVFWQVGTSATLGARTVFLGNLLTPGSISLDADASVSGRLLTQAGAVTLNSNHVSLCCDPLNVDPPTLPAGTAGAQYSQTITASGGTGTYTYAVTSGSLPAGLTLTPGGVLTDKPTQSGTFTFTVTATDSNGCPGTRQYTIEIDCPQLVLSPETLPDAMACVPYTQTITASGGIGPYAFSLTPDTPPFTLTPPTLTAATVQLAGTANTPGNYTYTVMATDTITGCVVSRTYTIRVNCDVMILPATLLGGPACAPLSCQILTASCGTPPYTFSAPPADLPPGLFLAPDGMFCGMPTTPGTYTFPVTATDAKSCKVTQTYTVGVMSAPLVISPPTLPNGTVGVPYPSQKITASCGIGPYTCSVTAGSLPPGLKLAGCTISDTPMTPGCFTFTVTVTDATGLQSSITYRICVTCPIVISPPVLPDASGCFVFGSGGEGVAYCQTITASCGIPGYTFTLNSGMLPDGLKLSPNGQLCGFIMTAGTFTFTVKATDSEGNSASIVYTLRVPGNPKLSPVSLPGAAPGIPFNETITASGGTPPYTLVLSGSLPPGLTFNPATGVISGTPTTVGVFCFDITVIDANGCSSSQQYCIVVAAGGPMLSTWGMLVLSVLLVGAGLVVIRKGGVT